MLTDKPTIIIIRMGMDVQHKHVVSIISFTNSCSFEIVTKSNLCKQVIHSRLKMNFSESISSAKMMPMTTATTYESIDFMVTFPVDTRGDDSNVESSGLLPVEIAKVTLTLLICIFGLLANMVVLFIIFILQEYKKSVTHWYVLQLAIADSVFLLTLPFQASQDLNQGWIYPDWVCRAKETILFLNYYASILFLMVMSIDRYIAVCHPFSTKLQNLRKQQSAFIITFVVWLVALLLTIPVMLYSITVGTPPNCRCTNQFPQTVNRSVICFDQFQGLEKEFGPKLSECCLSLPQEDPIVCRPAEFDESCIGDLIGMFGGSSGGGIPGKRNDTEDTDSNNVTTDYGEVPGGYQNLPKEFKYRLGMGSESNGMGNLSFENMTFLFPEEGYPIGGGGMGNPSFENMSFLFPAEGYPSDEGGSGMEKGPILYQSCHYIEAPTSYVAFLWFNFSVMFVLPFVVMTVCYGLLVHRFSATRFKPRDDDTGTSQRNSKPTRADQDRKKVTIMCATLVTAFVLCWVLFHAVHIAKTNIIYASSDEACQILTAVSVLLAYLNSALNPFLYTFLGSGFARKWKAVKTSSNARDVMAFISLHKKKSGVQVATKTSEGSHPANHPVSNSQPSSTITTKFTTTKLQ